MERAGEGFVFDDGNVMRLGDCANLERDEIRSLGDHQRGAALAAHNAWQWRNEVGFATTKVARGMADNMRLRERSEPQRPQPRLERLSAWA